MKELWKKIESSKLWFSLFILVVFLIFIFISNGFNGAIIDSWGGLAYYIDSLSTTTVSGNQMFYEVIWAILLIPILLLFNNKYVFNEKKIPFKERIKMIWPMLVVTTAIGIMGFLASGSLTSFNLNEFVAMVFLFTFVGIFEELLCRGWLQNEFIERFGKDYKGVIFSIILSGIIFGCMHIVNFFAGADLVTTLFQMLSCIIAGIFFGTIYYKTKNIWTCVFLHGFWDLGVSMSGLNETISCVTIKQTGSLVLIIMPIMLLLLDLPEILISLGLLTKSSVNESLPDKHRIKISEEQKEKDEKKAKKRYSQVKTYTFIAAVLLIGAGFAAKQEVDECMLYNKEYVKNAEIVSIKYDDYTLKLDDLNNNTNCYNNSENCILEKEYGINFKIEDGKLLINNLYTSENIKLNIEDVRSFSVFEKGDKYIVLVAAVNDKNGVVYYSDYLTKENIYNEYDSSKFKKSFSLVKLPSICDIGFIGLENRNPLFVTCYKDYYMMDNEGTIKKIKFN